MEGKVPLNSSIPAFLQGRTRSDLPIFQGERPRPEVGCPGRSLTVEEAVDGGRCKDPGTTPEHTQETSSRTCGLVHSW